MARPDPRFCLGAIGDQRGCVDTIQVRLRWALRGEDVARLIDEGFVEQPHRGERPDWMTYDPPRVFTDRRTGMRIAENRHPYRRWVDVQASVPRLLLGCNSRVHEVSAAGVLSVLDQVRRLLSATTKAARTGHQRCWVVRRLDITVDFGGPVGGLITAAELMRWPRCRPPVVYQGKRGTHFESIVTGVYIGPGRLICIYDKGIEMARRTRRGAPAPGTIGRVEARMRGVRWMRVLASVLEPCEPGQGLPLDIGDGRVAWRRLSLPALHQHLRGVVRGIEGRSAAVGRADQGLVNHVARWPRAVRAIGAHPCDERWVEGRARRVRTAALWRAFETMGGSLSEQCWPNTGPKPNSMLGWAQGCDTRCDLEGHIRRHCEDGAMPVRESAHLRNRLCSG